METFLRSLPISSAIDERYDGIAKTLHWLSFGLVAVQFAIGWTMPEIGVDRRPSELIEIHMSIGIAILVITAIRLAWRLARGAPRELSGAAWERRTAKAVQVGLYLLLFLMPLSGWADASARGWTIAAFGGCLRSHRLVGRLSSGRCTVWPLADCSVSSDCMRWQRSITMSCYAIACYRA